MATLTTLAPKHSMLNNIELLEPIDYDALELLLKSKLLKQYTTADGKPYECERAHLEKYKKRYVKRTKCVKVRYTRGAILEYGRVNPEFSLGLHCLKRQVRHTLCGKYLVDIDIVNAHPVILLNICKKFNYPCEKLQYYTYNREKVLKSIQEAHGVSREQAKQLVIILTYLGSYKKWLTDNNYTGDRVPFLIEYHNELAVLGEIIKKQNGDLTERLAAIKDRRNVNSIMSYYLQTIECYILEEIFLYCRKKRIINKTCVLSNDGIMIPREKYSEDLLEQFRAVIVEKFGIELKFEMKPMDKAYPMEEIVKAIENQTIQFMGKTFSKNEFELGVRNELEAFDKIISVFDDFKFVRGAIYGFDTDTGLWANGELIFKKIVSKMDDYLHIRKWSEKDDEYKDSNDTYNNKVGRMKDLVSYFKDRISFLPQYLDDDFFERTRNTTRGCLLFSNGILKTDWDTREIYFVSSFDRDMVFTSRINIDFTDYKDANALCEKQDIKNMKKVFFDIFGNQADVFIEYIASAIFGLCLKKTCYVIGETNAGKSTLMNQIKRAFSSDIIGDFDNKNFVDNAYSANDASSNRWALLAKNKRLLISSESVLGRVNTEAVKQYASGGQDEIVGRFHGGNEQSFVPSFNMLTMLNVMCSFTHVDDALKDRLIILKLQKSYKSVIEDPETDALRYTADEMSQFNDERYLDAFRWVIIKAYAKFIARGSVFDMSDELKMYLEDVVAENVDDGTDDKVDMLFDVFEFTGSEDDKEKSSAVVAVLESVPALRFLARDARKRSALFEKCGKACDVKIKTGRFYPLGDKGKQVRGYIGMKIIENTPEVELANR